MRTKEIEKFLLNKLLENKDQLLPMHKNINIEYNKEKPDCHLYLDNLTIGIEITCAMDENLQKTRKIRDSLDSTIMFSPIIFEKKKMSSKEIRERLTLSKKNLVCSAYRGNEMEEDTFNHIKKSIDTKIKKFDTYQMLNQNWLYIYHNNRASLRKSIVIKLLLEYINSVEIKFDILIIKIGESFYKFNNFNLLKEILN